MAGALAAAPVAGASLKRLFPGPMYPPVDLSYFDTPMSRGPFEVRFGYAAITWGGNDDAAIGDIAEVGFRGIQLRSNVLKEYGDKPKALAASLETHHLDFVALSSGTIGIDRAALPQEIQTHTRNARFLADAGGRYLQLIDAARPKGRPASADDFRKLGDALTEVGKRSIDLGIPLAYHHHMDSLGQEPEHIDRILDAADARYVKLLLDVAHYKQGGGDPAAAVRKFKDRILFVHLKDVQSPVDAGPSPVGAGQRLSYQFVELGRGNVDLVAVIGALREIEFRGWIVVELDRVPVAGRTPKDSAVINKAYIEEQLHLAV